MQRFSRVPICHVFSATGVIQGLGGNGRVRRRDFIKVVAGLAGAWPLSVWAAEDLDRRLVNIGVAAYNTLAQINC